MTTNPGEAVMRVVRLGMTPVKGMTHRPLPHVDLTASGPLHDRLFCVVDAGTGRVLRTVENEASMACEAIWRPPVLMLRTPVGDTTGVVAEGGTPLVGEYWDRKLPMTVVDGPWVPLLSRYFGRPVVLCRTSTDQPTVWAGPVSLVTTSSLAELARRIGRACDDGARFRATVVVDTGDAPAFIEDAWIARQLRLGEAVVAVDERLPRCAVVDRLPGAGGPDARVMAALVSDRRYGTDVYFGVSGHVVQSGRISLGDPVDAVGA